MFAKAKPRTVFSFDDPAFFDYPVHEAAKLLKKGEPEVLAMIDAGELDAYRSSDGWLIKADSLDRLTQSGRPA